MPKPNSESLQDIKIPYPTEGVIRTAAIDDTVSPEDSAQLAVNMNFDRIGAFQTRLGLTEFADDLDGEVKNFGTLNNTTIPGGYDRFVKYPDDTSFESTTVENVSAVKIDSTHNIVMWGGVGGDGFAQVAITDLDTGIITMAGSPLEFEPSSSGGKVEGILVDSTHVLLVWQGVDGDGFAQIVAIDGSYNLTVVGSAFEFDTTSASSFTLAQVDSSHFIIFYTGPVGRALVLAVNLGTFAVTAAGAAFTFDALNTGSNSCAPIGDGVRFINFWAGSGNDGFVQVFLVNTGTWAITAIGSPLEFDTTNGQYNSCASLGDGEHFINFWLGANEDGFVQCFLVNPSTYAVTAIGSALEFEPDGVGDSWNSALASGDGLHFVNFWKTSNLGYGQIFEVDANTYAVTALNQPVSFGDVINFGMGSVMLDTYHALNFWPASASSGLGAFFSLEGAPVNNNYLYAQEEDGDILNWDNPGWVVRRTGLNPANKARFAQYLNRIWMVNGSELNGGDPVMTSDGGDFDTTLVPADFPPGDFIQCGFEGRVWVADKIAGVVYFTDVVQFTPPNTYTLTYDVNDNYIKNFSPQNGQTITGLFVTPRALLLFQEDFIFRIYGAFSVDNYPAYNVGTYSQESIIQAKDGIYFHHSSGFYKFSYDGQPVEISRRIIDFVQAIPRTFYENVTGIYDGFDAVEWCIGPVTVEGVTFTNCFVRYTISTQIWTIYDYPENETTAMISYDDGPTLNMIMGTETGRVNKMDDGYDDLGKPIAYEFIDRWRSYTSLYAKSKSIAGLNIYNQNGAGANISFQTQDSGPNVWEPIGVIDENACSLIPTVGSDDFNAGRLRLSGFSKGTPVVFHGIEILSLDDKGYDKN